MDTPPLANQEILAAIRAQHPEWIDRHGDCTPCDRLLHELEDPETINQIEHQTS